MTYSVMRLPRSEGAGTDIIGFGSGIGDELIGAAGAAPSDERKSRTWGLDDYDVSQGDRDIGRFFKPQVGVRRDHPWMWIIIGQW
jgi:hypothetical protein